MNLQEILSIPIEGKTVCILGNPACGKTFLANSLYDKKHTMIHTDTYMGYDFKTQLYMLLDDITDKYEGQRLIIEGVLVPRLLRKGSELGTFYPDLIIECSMPLYVQETIYREQRPEKDYQAVKKMNTGLQSILNEYFFNTEARPEYLIWTNNYSQ